MFESEIKSAAKLIGDLLVEEGKFLLAVSDKIKKLEQELEWMQLFLRDADERQHHDAIICKWIVEIRDFAYEAEDILENYILKISSKSKGNFWNKLKWLPCCLRDAPALHVIGSDLDALTQKIIDLTTRMKTYGVKIRRGENGESSSYARQKELRRTVSHIKEDVVGKSIQGDICKILNKLEIDDYNIVVIHGMGGLGKTTLAREVYRHNSIKTNFKEKSWVHLSQNFQTHNVYRKILLDLIPEGNREERKMIHDLIDAELHRELYKMLKENSYLVLLDDIWTFEDWKLIESVFPREDSKSKLLVTTRFEDIIPGAEKVFKLKPNKLDIDSSWELLKKKAFGKMVHAEPTDMERYESLGKSMLQHSDFLPLAIIVLGGVLATKKTVKEWKAMDRRISLSSNRNKFNNKVYGQVYDVLDLSYYNLPYHLKPCFLYLGKFPKDYEISASKLCEMWIAEGIVSTGDDTSSAQEESLEENAKHYLNSLIQRSLVQVGKLGSNGRIKTCRLHNVTREVCLRMMEKDYFLQIIDDKASPDELAASETSPLANKRFRRLAIYLEKNMNDFLPHCMSIANPHLRTLSVVPKGDLKEESCTEWMKVLCDKLQLLRVLDLEEFCIGGIFPREIGNLIHLRYLSLKGTKVGQLPSSIGNLRYLQTLDLRIKGLLLIPNVLWRLRRLRHLYLPETYEITRKEKLMLHSLHQLLTLENIDMATLCCKDLLQLTNVRKITVVKGLCKKESLEFIFKSESMKSGSLKDVQIKFEGNILNEDPIFLYKHRNLRKIQFTNHPEVTLLPRMLPLSLTSLVFWEGKLKEDPMPILEKLPNLRFLCLYSCFYGLHMKCSAQGFSQLVHLKIDTLPRLINWEVERDSFPKLVKVEIWNCPLNKFPDVLLLTLEIKTNVRIEGIERHLQEPSDEETYYDFDEESYYDFDEETYYDFDEETYYDFDEESYYDFNEETYYDVDED